MRRRRTARLLFAAFLILGALVDGPAKAERGQNDSKAPVECCFQNSRYAGVCVVQPAEGETCASILDYLNSPSSSGKSYCGFTDIRGGWKEIACQEETSNWSSSVPSEIPDRVGAGPLHDTASDPLHEEADPKCWY